MSTKFSFDVPGTPRPKGSWSALPRRGGAGIYFKAPAGLKAWTRTIEQHARTAWPHAPLDEPVALGLAFTLQRPPSHLRVDGRTLRKGAPRAATGRRCGDLDKLARAALDALTGPVLADDSLVVDLRASKRYGSPEGLVVTLSTASTAGESDGRPHERMLPEPLACGN